MSLHASPRAAQQRQDGQWAPSGARHFSIGSAAGYPPPFGRLLMTISQANTGKAAWLTFLQQVHLPWPECGKRGAYQQIITAPAGRPVVVRLTEERAPSDNAGPSCPSASADNFAANAGTAATAAQLMGLQPTPPLAGCMAWSTPCTHVLVQQAACSAELAAPVVPTRTVSEQVPVAPQLRAGSNGATCPQ
jgi:hypothetical protein